MKGSVLLLILLALNGCSPEPEGVARPPEVAPAADPEANNDAINIASKSPALKSSAEAGSAIEGSADTLPMAAGTRTGGEKAHTQTAGTVGRPTVEARPEGFGQKDTPPDFKLKVLANGEGEQTLYSLVSPSGNGPVDGVVVAFVASWCGRCKESYPLLESLQKKHGDRLRILLLTAETDQAGKDKMVGIVKENGLTLPLLDAPPDLIELWLGEKKNIPRFYLLDYQGMIRVKDTGFGTKMKKLLPQHVAWLLARREQAQP